MAIRSSQKSLVVIAGPTASGKSALALSMAETNDGEVINADSMQVYADLFVLTARPDEAAMARLPHHLYGTVDGGAACSVAQWRDMAKECIEAVWTRGKLPVVVGGSGLYIRALLEGISDIPAIPEAIRLEVRALDTAVVADALQATDPHMAERLDPNDRQRLTRALEVMRATGRSLASFQGQAHDSFAADVRVRRIRLMPERDWLYKRCDARLEHMLASGALDEVDTLMARQLNPVLPIMKALGVREFSAHLAGECTRDEALAAVRLGTRHYAKRQMTWLRNQCADWETGVAAALPQLPCSPI